MMRDGAALSMAGLAIIVLSAAGCHRGADRSASSTVRDSAGVRIVENTGPAWRDGDGWTLAAEPELDIGVAEGDPHYQLDGVRDAVRLADGRIVIANAGSAELRYYDAAGRYLATSGRKGKGPGEFQELWDIRRLPGDTVATFDVSPPQISLFDSAGRFARSTSLHGAGTIGFPLLVGRLPDGSWVETMSMQLGEDAPRPGIARDTTPWIRFGEDGSVLDTVARLPGLEYVMIVGKGAFGFGPRELARETYAAVHGDHLYAANNASYEIRDYTPAGELRQFIRRRWDSRPVTDEDIDAVKAQRLASVRDDNMRRLFESRFSKTDFPDTYPAYKALIVDAGGDLWVKNYPRPTDTTATWAVFEPTGTLLGEMPMPVGFTVFEIGDDYVLGRKSDDLDVQHVVMYRLER